MSDNAITCYPSPLDFRLDTLGSFQLLSYGFLRSHHCGYLPPNPIQFLYLSLQVWHSPDTRRTVWSTRTITVGHPPLLGYHILPHSLAAVPSEFFATLPEHLRYDRDCQRWTDNDRQTKN